MANKKISSVNLLPEFLQTDKNAKFLYGTLDQLIQPPQLERIEGYIGTTSTPTYNASTDVYISESLPLRRDYQLEPALVVKDSSNNVQDVVALDDLVNEISIKGGNTSNLDRLFRSEFYSYDPRIDWDKLINYQDYYWLTTGPNTVVIEGQLKDTTSTYLVRDSELGSAFIFTPDGLTSDPYITLYRGNTYHFDVNSAHKFFVKTAPSIGLEDLYNIGVTNNGISTGTITLVVDNNTPDTLFYISGDQQLTQGQFIIKTVDQNSFIDVEADIIGKKNYVSGTGIALSNGMKIKFAGQVTPASYQNIEFFVEGVGTSIKLVDYNTLLTPESIASTYDENFDANPFDDYPFDNFKSLPLTPEYITINRASRDLNPWSRYNRWVHKDIIAISATANDEIPSYPSDKRAQRPIIEFNADLKLYNYGTVAINNIDLIDNLTKDAFKNVEGSAGYYVDGVLLEHGHRVVFNADTDSSVRGNVYQVNYIFVNNVPRLQLLVAETPAVDAVTSVNLGNNYQGTAWWYNGDSWKFAQQHTVLNTAPLFDLFDDQGISYSDTNYYLSNFAGNKLFGYAVGTGTPDAVLGFSLKYQNSVGVGSYLFDNYFMTDSILITSGTAVDTVPTSLSYCKLGDQYVNVWQTAEPYAMPLLTAIDGSKYYEPPLGLTNNPLNGPIASFTFSELQDHLQSMIKRTTSFAGEFPGDSNIRDIGDLSKYGTRLISNANPMPFAQLFVGKKEHSVIDAITKVANQYNQFKLALLSKLSQLTNQTDPVSALDQAMLEINQDKDVASPYYLSDMIAYGTDKTVRSFTVTDVRNVYYPMSTGFDLSALNLQSVLVYLNGTQLVAGTDFDFVKIDSLVQIKTTISVGDQIEIHEYPDTRGSFIPPTPTKLGLYPASIPLIYLDNTYVDKPVNVIQGHDGSVMLAYNDFRDAIILEYERRVYNNIKVGYKENLFDVKVVQPGAFRKTDYSLSEVNNIIQSDFIKWAGFYGIDYTENTSFDSANPFTWNYQGALGSVTNAPVAGYWRSLYKYFYDTDRPHTHPWEMLGFTNQPDWWVEQYGPAPYTSGNEVLWNDLELGLIQGVVNTNYARPGLSKIIPVDEQGNLKDPSISLTTNITAYNSRQGWVFGDQGPAETAWRRSSYWPFAVQKLLALAYPAKYSAVFYDVSRMNINIAGQWSYGNNYKFLNLKNLTIASNTSTSLTSGYSVLVTETGKQRTSNYVNELVQDITNVNMNLFYKVGGFISKTEMQVIIDAYEPNTVSPGAVLPLENYNVILNVSNPVKSSGISGIVIQKINGQFVVKGYDQSAPYFSMYQPVRNSNTPTLTVGGVSESYVNWAPSTTTGSTGLSSVDTTTAKTASTGNFYQVGQIVAYGNNFYKVKVSHQSGSTFNSAYFQILPSLPTVGGAVVQMAEKFSNTITQISYGTAFDNIQQVYDLIIGYGQWLKEQGFVFDEFNSDLESIIDWNFSAKEFLYWSVQNWANGSVITVSPFANQLKYQFNQSVVDNIFDSFYEYSILKADGTPYEKNNLSVSRIDGVCTITTVNSTDGIYFARLNSIQKEHAIVFDNKTIFNDVVYDIETGYRQQRMKLSGFRTANWEGDYFSPGFVYDTAVISNWKQYTDYAAADIVRYSGNYYSAIRNLPGATTFDFNSWSLLGSKPVAGLLPNFDYKINQFEDFYSLDIDNFDAGQEKMAQHLTGYTPRVYLNNIFTNPISQYKFYQGFIKEKGTKNSISKLAKATLFNQQGQLDYNEEWAFRVGYYGSYSTYQELEISLQEGTFVENPQVINFVDKFPVKPNDLTIYGTPSSLAITPVDYTPSNTFSTDSDTDSNLKLINAGYARLDDVTATAYNENSLLDIANNGSIMEGDVIWLGFKQNGGWDVLRYTLSDAGIVGIALTLTGNEMTFYTNHFHNLSEGQVVSIVNFNSQVDGVYLVKHIPNLNQFTVATQLTIIVDQPLPSPGRLYTFESMRFTDFDNLPSDTEILSWPIGTKVWIDSDANERWSVYEKINSYTDAKQYAPVSNKSQQLGWNISKGTNADHIFTVNAPNYVNTGEYGKISVYKKVNNASQKQFEYQLNNASISKNYHTPGVTDFGHAMVYDDYPFSTSTYGLIFAGAPSAGNIKAVSVTGGALRYSTGAGTANSNVLEGLVKISSIDEVLYEEIPEFVLASPISGSNQKFGSSLFVQKNTSTKIMLVGAPGTELIGTGAVYAYRVTSTSTVTATYTTSITAPVSLNVGSQWGYSLAGSNNVEAVAIGAPGYNTNQGLVCIYTGTGLTYLQTISSPFSGSARFGETIIMSADGSYLFITAPDSINTNKSLGAVGVYTNSNGLYILDSIISSPFADMGMRFATDISVNTQTNLIAIASVGNSKSTKNTFDSYSIPDPAIGTYVNSILSAPNSNVTTFDSGSTSFYGEIQQYGTVYLYTRQASRFVLSEQLAPASPTEGTSFGYSISIDQDNAVYVGAPAFSNAALVGSFYEFNPSSTSSVGLSLLRYQEDLVTVDTIQRAVLIDTYNENILEYLEVIDPIKGKISGLAEQELSFKSAFDPAVYSIGVAGTVNDTNSNWLDEHVGQLWWDLSTVKYQWYEQGDLTYRKNNWGSVFPGATIDVYEWVGSDLLPSEWSSQADTPAGLTNGISGQPKFPDNSVISVKQVYNAVTNSFNNYYYYWVKNKITVPEAKNRRISSYQVASVIADPTAYGIKYAAVISKDAVALANVGTELVGDRINFNIATDSINNDIPKHTEWLLLQEGNADSVPNTLLEKKLIDSLMGHDTLGTPVPDPSLSDRVKYGVGIRPQQTLFKDRINALRNLFEFTNSILLENQITGNYSFTNLNAQESIPNKYSNKYDQIVEDNEALLLIDTTLIKLPQLSCTISDGKIRSVSIDDSGFGYVYPPTITIVGGSNTPAVITTNIDEFGRVVSVNIENAGSGYTTVPNLIVRPYTVIVLADSTYNGNWTQFVYDIPLKSWLREHTQQYNTTLYWKYVDWSAASYNPYQDYAYTVDYVYELEALPVLEAGQYIKVKNSGDGRYIIVSAVASGGTFSDTFDLVYSQNGTIQISDAIWNTQSSPYNFDDNNTYDQTLFNQTPDLELRYILTALKHDIFVNDLKINWNLFFFKAVKYALSEQKLLDWAFKTSFISVTNYAGELDQRPIYKLQDSSYYQQYLEEVKPYHTQIRNFTTNHTTLDNSQSFITDFDLPSYYNKTDNKFEVVSINSTLTNVYPWKAWADNYTFQIGSIAIGNGGSGYLVSPSVVIETAPGDTGHGATARAYISSGAVVQIEITNPGTGYQTAPIVRLIGGGNTALTPAIVSAQLVNEKVRTNKIGIKFDRISRTSEIGNITTDDRIVCNGTANTYELSWLAGTDKSKITVKLDGELVLDADYTINYYSKPYVDYNKKYCAVVFLNYVPNKNQILEVTYPKNINLLNASERIINYYTATSGMPGIDLPQLMTGIEYPKTTIEGLSLNYSSNWDDYYSVYGQSVWADQVNYYQQTHLTAPIVTGSNVLVLNTTTGIAVGQLVNLASSNITQSTATMFKTQQINSSTDVVVVSINTGAFSVVVNSTVTQTVNTGTVEFWSFDSNTSLLDSAIAGGSWNSGMLTGTGTDISSVIIDGSGFYTADSSYAPEELVPGQATESVGINVYTKNVSGAPTIYTGYFSVDQGVPVTAPLKVLPTSIDSMTLVFDRQLFTYTTNTNWTNSSQYTIDWANSNIIIPPQQISGLAGYTIVGVGGGQVGSDPGVIDYQKITVNGSTTAQVRSLAGDGAPTVRTAYVTVNGVPINQYANNTITDTSVLGYILTYTDADNKRAAVDVYGLSTGTISTVQAWFFGFNGQYYNRINDQIFNLGNTYQNEFTLTQPPGNIGPAEANIIVEIDDGAGRRRMIPPAISYYQITDVSTSTSLTFPIDNNVITDPAQFSLGGVSYANLKVFVNGNQIRPGFDFSIGANSTFVLNQGVVNVGDVVASVALPSIVNYDFTVSGDQLILSKAYSNCQIKAITYTDQDNMMIRTERFVGNPSGRYIISRPVLNTNYVWVQLGGIPLIDGVDYTVLEDNVTVQLSQSIQELTFKHFNGNYPPTYNSDDPYSNTVIITSVSDTALASTVLGYRIFNDMFNNTQFKRLSYKNSTYLTQPLSYSDTEIYVADAGALTAPLVSKKIPGVIIIDGERIEFWKVTDNVLGQLRRGTFGTSPSFYCEIGTSVIDQSPAQSVPFTETVLMQHAYITTATTSYTISQSTATLLIPETANTTKESIHSDGITLQYTPLAGADSFRLEDQISVYYGGKPLRKTGMFYQDTSIAYDSPIFNQPVASIATPDLLPVTDTLGTAYIITSTNQVWVYENSIEESTINGFVYHGLNYLPPEFSVSTSDHRTMTLNIDERFKDQDGRPDHLIKLTIVKKQVNVKDVWNNSIAIGDTLSLMDSTTIQAKFLQAGPAELPDSYYYGGDKELTIETGFSLTDNNNQPLEGF